MNNQRPDICKALLQRNRNRQTYYSHHKGDWHNQLKNVSLFHIIWFNKNNNDGFRL